MQSFLKANGLRALLFLTLLLSVAFYDVVFLGKTFKVTTANSQALPSGAYGQENNKPRFIPVNGTDTPVMEEPSYAFIKNNLRQGIFPLWNPHQACGFPFIGMIEIGFFFPLTFIMYLLPDRFSWDILILSRLLFGGLFTFWFMRAYRFRFIPALTAAIIFMLTGPLVLFQYWTANVDILTPLLCVAYERILKRPRSSSNIAILAFLLGMTCLAGHPEHIFLVNFFAFIFFLHRLFVYRKKVTIKPILLALSSAYSLGLGFSAIVFFPFIQNLLFEFWSAHPDRVGLLLEEHRERALSILLPHFFQAVPLTFQFSFAGWWGGYLGILPVALAFLSLFTNQKRGMNYFLAATAVILVSKQYALPFINWIGYLPLLNQCRYASHTPVLVAFCVAVLAGMGVRNILSRQTRDIFFQGALFSMILTVVVSIMLYLQIKTPNFSLSIKASLFALGIILAFQTILFLRDRGILSRKLVGLLVITLVFAELFCYIHRERPHRFDSFGKVPYMELLKSSPERVRSYGNFWAFYPNTASGFGVDDLGYFFGLVPKRFVHFVNTVVIPNHFRNDLRPPAVRAIPITDRENILNLLNVRYIITPATDEFQNRFAHFKSASAQYPQVYAQEVKIFERLNAYPRAFIVHRAIMEPDEDKSLVMLNQMKEYSRLVAIINYPLNPKMAELLKMTPTTDGSKVQIKKYSPNEILLSAQMENPGLLVLSDAYHPDWKAWANGKETPVYQTDYLLRSVFLPAGNHEVKFVFQPMSFYFGGLVSLLSFFGILLLYLWSHIKNHTRRS